MRTAAPSSLPSFARVSKDSGGVCVCVLGQTGTYSRVRKWLDNGSNTGNDTRAPIRRLGFSPRSGLRWWCKTTGGCRDLVALSSKVNDGQRSSAVSLGCSRKHSLPRSGRLVQLSSTVTICTDKLSRLPSEGV